MHARSEWGAKPPVNALPRFDHRLRGIAVHWNGPAVTGSTPAVLRADQRYHQETKGWSDIAYNLAVDQAGEIWEARGLGVRSGANGSTEANVTHGAVVCLLGEGQVPSHPMLQGLKLAVAQFAFVNGLTNPEVRTHNDVRPTPTACPGPELTAYVHGGLVLPAAPQEEEVLPKLFRVDGQDEVWLSDYLSKRHIMPDELSELQFLTGEVIVVPADRGHWLANAVTIPQPITAALPFPKTATVSFAPTSGVLTYT